jgi:hypothetical protein
MLAALGGCGRFGFDEPTSDASGNGGGDGDAAIRDDGGGDGAMIACSNPVGHDEDADGVDDACDLCPQVADDQSDTDGDLVGNACDLLPTQQQRVLFDPFLAMGPEWSFDARVTHNGDSFTMPAAAASISVFLNGAPGRTVLDFGGRVTGVGTGGRQLAVHVGELAGSDNHYCELYSINGAFDLKLTVLSNTTYETIATTPIPGQMTAGSNLRLIFEHRPPDLRCVAVWNGVRYEVTGTAPGGFALEEMWIAANRIDAEIQNFVRLTTP